MEIYSIRPPPITTTESNATALPSPSPLVDLARRAVASELSLDVGAALVSDALEEPEVVVFEAFSAESLSALSTSAESLESSVKEALTEEVFLHSEGASAEPLTKLAAIHYRTTILANGFSRPDCHHYRKPTWYSRPSTAEETMLTTPFLPIYFSGSVTAG